MEDDRVRMARYILIGQALESLRQGLEQIGQVPTTGNLAVLAAIANVAHRLSLQEVLQDERDRGREVYHDQMHIIMQNIPLDRIIEDYLKGDRGGGVVLRHVHAALGI